MKPCIFMSLCILPSKHFVPIFQQRQSVQDSHQFCLILLQASLLPLWVLRKRSAAEGLVPPPLLKALPFCFTIGTRGREKPDLAKAQGILRFWENKIVHCLQHRILTSSSCGFSYYIFFFCKRKWCCHPHPITQVLTLLQTLGCPSIKYWLDLSRSRLEKIKIKSPLKTYFISWHNDTKVILTRPLWWPLRKSRKLRHTRRWRQGRSSADGLLKESVAISKPQFLPWHLGALAQWMAAVMHFHLSSPHSL